MNKSWPRWIFASVSKHFKTYFDALTPPIVIYIEGQHRDTRTDKDFVELRVDGPRITEMSHDYWRLYGEVNILVQSTMDDTNYHRIHENCGLVAAAFTDIEIFKYGNHIDDDDSFIGCYKLVQDEATRERIQISHFGQIEPDIKLLQSTVEGHYEMNMEGS